MQKIWIKLTVSVLIKKNIYKKKKSSFYESLLPIQFNLEWQKQISNCEHRISLKNASYKNRFEHVTYTFLDEKS